MKPIKFNSVNMLIGVLIIAAGVLLLLFKAGILPPDYQCVIFSWPMILISIGFICLFSRQKWGFGLLLMLIGSFFLLPKLNIEAFAFVNDNRWAIILVIIGVIVVFKSIFGKNKGCCHWETRWETKVVTPNRTTFGGQDAGYIHREYVFGGSKEKIDIKNFKGGKISCIFGGMELDLSDAELAERVNTLEVRTVFGGVSIYVPADWYIEIRQQQVMGNFEDKRPKSRIETNNEKTLIINAEMVLGGGEIKCK